MYVQAVHSAKEAQQALNRPRIDGRVIGFVPTMGALHAGHRKLIETAKKECGFVVVSIFVNPLQFGPNEDYGRYPKTLESDLDMCRRAGVDLVFAPTVQEVYPASDTPLIDLPEKLTAHLCGPFRPGHFRGVATVVLRLFEIVRPSRAYFGEKDAQQLVVVRHIVKDRKLPIEIVGVPTVREPDGLALSSRNRYLTPHQRTIAPFLYRALKEAVRLIRNGDKDSAVVRKWALRLLDEDLGISVEYLEIVDQLELQLVTTIEGPVLVAAAAWVGTTRLIDNILVEGN
jgi:pantoate--beta-alanine ligase